MSIGGLILGIALASSTPPPVSEAISLFESHRYGEARRLLEPQAKTDSSGETAYWLGRVAMRQQDFDAAVEWLERAAAARPGLSERHHWLGRAYGQKAVRASIFKQAALAGKVRKQFEEAVRLDPGNLEARFDLEEFYLVAPGIMGGSLEKAETQAREIRSRDPMRGYRAYGRLYDQRKEPDHAERELRAAIEKFSTDSEPYYWLANHYQRVKETGRAIDVFEQLLRSDPSAIGAYYAIARLALASGERVDRAEECLKTYLTKQPGKDDPPPAWAHFRLGALYEKKGDRAAARAEYEAALKLDPGLADARQALKKL